MKRLTAVYERDEAGWWVASVPRLEGCHTQGRSIERARTRLREAIEACDPDIGPYELREEIRLPARIEQMLTRRQTAQARLEKDQAKANDLTRRAVRTLVREMDLSVRDAGALLGLSHQRVQQLASDDGG